MFPVRFSLVSVVLLAPAALAQSPQMGGPMKHLMVSFDGTALSAHADENVPTPILQDHGVTFTGAASVLNGTMHNAQYGWMVEGFWRLPLGSVMWIEQLAASPDLLIYAGGGSFAPIFETDNSEPRWQWNGMMRHHWYAATDPGDYWATYRVYFGDSVGVPTPGYTAAEITLNFTAVPAPSGAALAGVVCMVACRRRRRGA